MPPMNHGGRIFMSLDGCVFLIWTLCQILRHGQRVRLGLLPLFSESATKALVTAVDIDTRLAVSLLHVR